MMKQGEAVTDELGEDPDLIATLRGIHIDAVGMRDDLGKLKVEQSGLRRLLNRVTALGVLNLATMVLTCAVMIQVLSLVHQVDDCLPPDGTCAQRNQATTQLVILSVSYQSEAQRLTTEIRVGEKTGQTDALAVRKQRLAEVSTVLQQIGQNLKDVQAGRRPRNEIPTELATAVPQK